MTRFKLQGICYFGILSFALYFTIISHAWTGAMVISVCLLMGIMVILFPKAKVEEGEFYDENDDATVPPTNIVTSNALTYYGHELNFKDVDIESALTRHFPYYTVLDETGKQKFMQRLDAFIAGKTFKIHNSSGFREMPMLISATAIQLSFGMNKYLLPNFTTINIYPEEIVLAGSSIRFLEGNVSGHSINISWKYFLEGFQLPDDGDNVGLHEMAHAYYYQSFGPCEEKDNEFIETFDHFNSCGKQVFYNLPLTYNGIYSAYAQRNFQEFWAESIEIFFEKPVSMKTTFPELYQCISSILRQDPAREP